MKIDSGVNYLLSNHTQTTGTAARGTSFSETLIGKTQETSNTASGTVDVKQVDFTNMTRQEMRDWMNDEVISGKMTLDESAPFMLMTMKIPVGGGFEIPAASDNERIDFMERAQRGIKGALFRDDTEAANRLQAVVEIMLANQGQKTGVDTHA